MAKASQVNGFAWPANWWESEFGERIFLNEQEWEAYLRRPPIRYTAKTLRKHRLASHCEVCGKPPTAENPLQAAHKIPFFKGVQHLGLTPTFLDRPERLLWAHRRGCNTEAELGLIEALVHLRAYLPQGMNAVLPKFLRPDVLTAWESLP